MPVPLNPIHQLSHWEQHLLKWSKCTGCALHQVRKKVVLARGQLPCEVLFIGEAPGQAEDVLGEPFRGPAGILLEKIISDAGWNAMMPGVNPVSRAITNLVGCIPKESKGGEKIGDPPQECIDACSGRLIELIRMANPKLIVCVGGLATKAVPKILEKGNVKRRSTAETHGAPVSSALRRGPRNDVRRSDYRKTDPQHLQEPIKVISIVHPAAILRANISGQGLMVQRSIVTLRDAMWDLYVEKKPNGK